MKAVIWARAALDRFATGRRRLIGMSLVRIGFGANIALMYLANMPYRNMLYGPAGQTSFATFSSAQHAADSVFSFYSLSSGTAWFNAVYFTGLTAAVVWTVVGGRVLTVVNAALLWSLDVRNPGLLDGGDNLARILILLLMFCTTDAYLSPMARRVRARAASGSQTRPTLPNSLHNTAAVLIVFQICILYAVSSFWKIVDTRWREGNALYYISQIRQFQYTDTLPSLMRSATLVTLFCYLTIAVQLSVVLLTFSRRLWLRDVTLLAVVGMHLGIMIGMGLVSFGLFMISADSVLMSDDGYRKTAGWLRARAAGAAARLHQVRAAGPSVKPAEIPETVSRSQG